MENYFLTVVTAISNRYLPWIGKKEVELGMSVATSIKESILKTAQLAIGNNNNMSSTLPISDPTFDLDRLPKVQQKFCATFVGCKC